jgi:DNA helicase-2/ATP-dependent DNA helicase PcrA
VPIDLALLNPPQCEAVEHGAGPLLVLAGAGSGKTRVITYRVARLIEKGIPGAAILALSFTNKAAGEMHERTTKLCGAGAKKVWMGTFHALGLQLLRETHRKQPFTIYDAADQLGLVREVLRHLKWEDRRWEPKAIQFRISRWKNLMLSPADLEARPQLLKDEYDDAAAQVFPKYEEALRGYAAYDFDDLIVAPVRLARPEWQERWRYVLVDEYQDTNKVQLAMIQHLGGAHGNVTVVGDDDQSIYGWRGAQASNILAFEKHFPGARIVKLEQNYRSRPEILKVSNAVIRVSAKRHEKTLWTKRAEHVKPRLVVLDDPEAEARFVATEISALSANPSDVAVLYRSNLQARVLEDAMREANLPYEVIGGQEFYERKEVKDVLAYLRVAYSRKDEISIRRVVNYPARGIGAATLAKAIEAGPTLYEGLAKVAPAFTHIIEQLKERIEKENAAQAAGWLVEEIKLYQDLHDAASSAAAADRRIGNVKDLIQSLEGRQNVQKYLQLLALRSASQGKDEGPADKVTLTTLHGSKGLEFPVVFLVGLEDGLLPHSRTLNPIATDVLDDAVDLDEERRLLYVGITRARERLYMTHARTRIRRGQAVPVTPSRFLGDIPLELVETSEQTDPKAVGDACMAQLWQMLKKEDPEQPKSG